MVAVLQITVAVSEAQISSPPCADTSHVPFLYARELAQRDRRRAPSESSCEPVRAAPIASSCPRREPSVSNELLFPIRPC